MIRLFCSMGGFCGRAERKGEMDFYNDKTRRKIAAAIVIMLVAAMVLPLLLYAL